MLVAGSDLSSCPSTHVRCVNAPLHRCASSTTVRRSRLKPSTFKQFKNLAFALDPKRTGPTSCRPGKASDKVSVYKPLVALHRGSFYKRAVLCCPNCNDRLSLQAGICAQADGQEPRLAPLGLAPGGVRPAIDACCLTCMTFSMR